MHKFPYQWRLSDGYPAKEVEHHGTTVMTTFACGGGSSMGYKLAGYDVVAANDIDKNMEKVYLANHAVKEFFLCPIKDLLKKDDLPSVDVLDGSPPCSVFSVAGKREAGWQNEKMFKEGQSKQILDDLFFDFIDLVGKMKPKIVIAENVKGMLLGNAKWYVREVFRHFKSLGYTCQVFLFNSATMGVPQSRERVFFICNLAGKKVSLDFDEKPIPFSDVSDYSDKRTDLSGVYVNYWKLAKPGESVGKFKSVKKMNPRKVANTLHGHAHHHHKYPRILNLKEVCRIGSWPHDYDFCGIQKEYIIGMSVPPVMMANVALEVYNQLLQ